MPEDTKQRRRREREPRPPTKEERAERTAEVKAETDRFVAELDELLADV